MEGTLGWNEVNRCIQPSGLRKWILYHGAGQLSIAVPLLLHIRVLTQLVLLHCTISISRTCGNGCRECFLDLAKSTRYLVPLHHDSDVIPVLMGLAQPQTPRRQRTRKTLTGCSLPRTSNTNNWCRYPTRALRILSTLQIELTMDDFRTFLSMNKGNMCEVGVGNTRVDDNEGGE